MRTTVRSGEPYSFYAKVTKQGLTRLPEGCKKGDLFLINSLSPGATGKAYWCAHVQVPGLAGIWTLGEGDWTIANQ